MSEEIDQQFAEIDQAAKILMETVGDGYADNLAVELFANWLKTAAVQASLFYGVATGELKADVVCGEVKFFEPTEEEKVKLAAAVQKLKELGLDFTA